MKIKLCSLQPVCRFTHRTVPESLLIRTDNFTTVIYMVFYTVVLPVPRCGRDTPRASERPRAYITSGASIRPEHLACRSIPNPSTPVAVVDGKVQRLKKIYRRVTHGGSQRGNSASRAPASARRDDRVGIGTTLTDRLRGSLSPRGARRAGEPLKLAGHLVPELSKPTRHPTRSTLFYRVTVDEDHRASLIEPER